MSSSTPDTREWSNVRIAVVDVEGNGAQPPGLVELAICLVTDGRAQPARSWLVKPPTAISWRAKRIHGISNDDVKDALPIADIADDVLDVLAGADLVVGHQVNVDLDVMTRSLPAWVPPPAVDTLRLARAQYPDLSSHKLGDLIRALGLDPLDGRAHRAGHDTTVTARLLVHLVGSLPQPVTVADLQRRGSKPVPPGTT